MNNNVFDIDISYPNNITTESELFFLYGIISSINAKTIVELGGGTSGICSRLFLKAQKYNPDAKLFSVDILEMKKFSERHFTIQKDCGAVTTEDLQNERIDVLFFDCHTVVPQLDFYSKMLKNKLIDDDTILILHDTNLFHEPFASLAKDSIGNIGYYSEEGYVHQWVERNLVNYFKLHGYDIFSLSTKKESHNQDHTHLFGLSVCQKFKPLKPIYLDYPR
jgi:hypothetical protein